MVLAVICEIYCVHSLSLIFLIYRYTHFASIDENSFIAVSDIRQQCCVKRENYASSFLGSKEAVKNAFNRDRGPIFNMGMYFYCHVNIINYELMLIHLNICYGVRY